MITGVLSRISVYQMHKRWNALPATPRAVERWLFLLVPVALPARLLAFGAELLVDWSLLRAQHGVDPFDLLVANLAHFLVGLVTDRIENLPQLPHLIIVQLKTG